MRRIIPAAILILLTAGCATDYDTDETPALGLDGWIGATDRELVLSWGAPDAMYQLADGSRVLTWRSVYTGPATGIYEDARPGVADGQPVTPFTPPSRYARYECVTNIEVGPFGKVRDYALQGNGCPQQPE